MAGLQRRLDEFKKSFESGIPPYNAPHEVIDQMHRATAELKATGIEERALKVGDRPPSITLFNQDRVQVDSADLLRVSFHIGPSRSDHKSIWGGTDEVKWVTGN